MRCGAGSADTLAHYVSCPRIREWRSTFFDGRRMSVRAWLGRAPQADVQTSAQVDGVRRVVIATLAYRRARALWMEGGRKQVSNRLDAWVRGTPTVFSELALSVRAAQKAFASNRRAPPRGGACLGAA